MQQDPLSQLNDIIAPEPITWWPLAWGWYIVIAIVLAALGGAIYFLIKRHQTLKAKKETVNLLKALHDEPHPQKVVKQTNEILKRAALAYAPRDMIARLSGDKWLNVINHWAPSEQHQISKEFAALAYQPKCSAASADKYLAQAISWAQNTLPLSPKKVANPQDTFVKQESRHV